MKPAYLNDSAFLAEFDRLRIKEQLVKITLLNWLERPIQEIQARISSGSVNYDGNSAMRRTANLNAVADAVENDLTNINQMFSVNKKIKLEVGFLNTTDKYKEFDWLWFPLGTYVIISASVSNSIGSASISLQLKDKMCLLNGDCGGTIPAATELDVYDEYYDEAEGGWVKDKPLIYRIIQELVNHFGGEQLGKIFISDVPSQIKSVCGWNNEKPLYICQDDQLNNYFTMDESTAKTYAAYKEYNFAESIGYEMVDFVYPESLTASAGDSVVTILDKIKNKLGNYEYFYDVYGNFIFQEKKNYLNTSLSSITLKNLSSNDYLVSFAKGGSEYDFTDGTLIASYQNSPQFNMIKNDFIVWGERSSVTGNAKIPLRYHIAIDTKPTLSEEGYDVFPYTDEGNLVVAKMPVVCTSRADFPKEGTQGQFYYDKASDIIYKWGYPEDTSSSSTAGDSESNQKPQYIAIDAKMTHIVPTDWRTELYLQAVAADVEGTSTASNDYAEELKAEWPKIFDIWDTGDFYDNIGTMNYFLDFIDTASALGEYNVNNIGRRSKVVNDKDVNTIFEPDIPNLVIIRSDADEDYKQKVIAQCELEGFPYIVVETQYLYDKDPLGKEIQNIVTGGRLNAAHDAIRDLLYQYTTYNESISLSCIPVYYLEPNIRVTVKDSLSGIQGDYVIKTISLPLDVNGTMSLSCTRALDKI